MEAGEVSVPSHSCQHRNEIIRGVQGPFSVVDVHTHVLNARASRQRVANAMSDDALGALLRTMDEAGVNHGFVLTMTAEDIAAEIRWNAGNPVASRALWNRTDQLREWSRSRNRFWLFVNRSNPLRETFLEDLESDFDRGAEGWKIMPLFYGFLGNHPGFRPACEICWRRHCPVILDLSNWHIGQYPLHDEVVERRQAVRTLEDYGRLLEPLFYEFDTLHICLAHLGTPRDERDHQAVFDFLRRHPNAFVDASLKMVNTVLFYRTLIEAVGPRKVVRESDYVGPSSHVASRRLIGDCDFVFDPTRRRN